MEAQISEIDIEVGMTSTVKFHHNACNDLEDKKGAVMVPSSVKLSHQ